MVVEQASISACILVVDDDKDNVRILETYLKSSGYTTDRAFTGAEAIRKINETMYDLILLDVMLPDTSGYQICEKIKSTPGREDIPITMVTALDKIDDKLKSLNLGAEDFLSKPIDEKELLLKVRRQIKTKVVLEKNRREKQELKALGNILSINYYEKTLDDILRIITTETTYLLDSERTTIFLKNGNKLVSKGPSKGTKPLIIPADVGVAGHVASTGEHHIANESHSNDKVRVDQSTATDGRTKRIIAFPIFHKNRVIGVIQSVNKSVDYTEYDLKLIQKVADHTANVLIRFYAEKKLKDSERLHRNLMERQSNAIFTVNNNNALSFANEAFTNLTGYKSDEIHNKDIKILFIPSELKTLEELGEAKEIESTIISKGFDMLPVSVTITRYEIDSKQSGRIFSVIDLRDRKALEAQQFEIAKMRQDFNSMIVHDLKNPLSIIIGFAELISNESLGSLSEKQKDFMGKIIASSEELLNLTNEILEVSKYEAGKMPLSFSDTDISALIQDVVVSQSLGFRNKSIEFIEHKIELPILQVDRDKMKRLFTNLFSNALKFTPENGKIEVFYKPVKKNDGQYLEISVKDSGVGIPSEDVATIFSKYKQSKSNQRHTRDKGTGLGLAICKMIVESHGGEIEVHSEVNVGTTFVSTIPLVQQHEQID
jgi:PAS domain S-box-containing protein